MALKLFQRNFTVKTLPYTGTLKKLIFIAININFSIKSIFSHTWCDENNVATTRVRMPSYDVHRCRKLMLDSLLVKYRKK